MHFLFTYETQSLKMWKSNEGWKGQWKEGEDVGKEVKENQKQDIMQQLLTLAEYLQVQLLL